MGRKKYFAATEEDFIGMEILNNAGTSYSILPWDGKRAEKDNVKLYPVHCKVCEVSDIYFDSKFYIRKGDALCGYTPCGCSKTYKMNDIEFNRTCKMLCDSIGKDFLGVHRYDSEKLKNTQLSIYCPVHCSIQNHTTYNTLRAGSHGCTQCSVEGTRNSKFKTTEQFLDTFKLPDHVQVINDTVTEDKEGQKKYWYLFCDKCSYDEYVKVGICTGTFKTTRGQLQKGALPCRCNPTYPVTKEMAKYGILKACQAKGYTFQGFTGQEETYSKAKFSYTCTSGHNSESNHHKMVTMGYGCAKCLSYGYYKDTPDREDFLYLISLWDRTDDIFSKVGRSFNVKTRYKEYTSKGLVTEEFMVLKGRHENIYNLEQACHRHLGFDHYVPDTKFGGSATECFGLGMIPLAAKYLRENSGKYNIQVMKDSL